jgi:2-aminobenzoate-CoA ligase
VFTSGHLDSFARELLPSSGALPVFLLDSPDCNYPNRINCVSWLLDRWIKEAHGDRPCLISYKETWSYADLAERVNRIANVLTSECEFVPGNRVLLRSANTPMMVAAYLAIMKAGGIAVATMPLLRAKELAHPIEKAQTRLAICDHRLMEEMQRCQSSSSYLQRVISFGDAEAELERLMRSASPEFEACDTALDDVCLLAFTSGTTGGPKATMHFHRDILAIANSYGKHILKAERGDRFTGTPPLAFTFSLGGLVIFPLAVGASCVLLEKTSPGDLLAAIRHFKPTTIFTAPTAYKAILPKLLPGDTSSLHTCVSAGEHLPCSTFEGWRSATGLSIMDGIGSTEMLHIFIASSKGEIRPGATGKPVPGYEARVVDDHGRTLPPGQAGHLAVRGPTGCRYLDDSRQTHYVRNGWNYTGDIFCQDTDGYFWFKSRSDDMIVSAGYNISASEVEEALLEHPSVAECAVIGAPDPERSMAVTAYVVLAHDAVPGPELALRLQDHVKAQIAPYKYPRRIEFRKSLPKTPTGKLQRSVLRDEALTRNGVMQCSAAEATAGPR